jgi:hypothetical protein
MLRLSIVKNNEDNHYGDYLDIDIVKHDYIIIDDNRDYLVVDYTTGELKGTHNTYKSANKHRELLEYG